MSVVVGIFFGVIFFSAQAVLCAQGKSFLIKLAPVLTVAAVLLLTMLSDTGILLGIALKTIAVMCALGDAFAWAVYYLMMKRK